MSLRLLILAMILALGLPSLPRARVARAQAPSSADTREVAAFLDAQPGPLKSFREGDQTAAMIIVSEADYYGLSPRLYLALLEASASLLSNPNPPQQALDQPFGTAGPNGFAAQIDWASRALRAGLGPYNAPPTLRFSDGTTLTLSLQQAPEGLAVQRFLALERSQPEWRTLVTRFNEAFQRYFNNQLPSPSPRPSGVEQGFLKLPWPAGVRVRHLAYFDHKYPTVDSGDDGNSYVVNYLGQGGVQYDGHDGHDYVFLDQPIGTPILAAAAGIAYARTVRGNGVVILHDSGYETVYWHLDQFAPIFDGRRNSDRGVRVEAGDLIGTSGRSGFVQGTPHLHFEVRVQGRQTDPYGWYGPGPDPCVQYRGCVESTWLWHPSLIGSYDFTPPSLGTLPPADTTPPLATLTVQPRADLLFLARFDGHPVQQVGQGFALVEGGLEYAAAREGQGLRVPPDAGLSYQASGNLSPTAGTILFWADLPASYPPGSGRSYLLATSAKPDDPARVYSGTLALHHEQIDGARRWNFWTSAEDGNRHDLLVDDMLAPGLHHFAITWEAEAGTKALYIDGRKVAEASALRLPAVLGERIELGRFTRGFGYSGATLDELAIFGKALDEPAIAALFKQGGPLEASTGALQHGPLQIDVNALDDGGEIVAVQLGIDGQWEAPQPYFDSYTWRIPPTRGPLTIGARFLDRANNSSTISATVIVEPASVYLPLLQAAIFDPRRSSRAQTQHLRYIPTLIH